MGDPRILLSGFLGLIAIVAVVFWPRRGLFFVLRRRLATTDEVIAEDVLKQLYHGHGGKLEAALGLTSQRLDRALSALASRGLIARHGTAVSLTDDGRAKALHLIRAHRLYERYLADRTSVDPSEWHELAELAEHRLDPEQATLLSERMGRPAFDPHGDPIPSEAGVLRDMPGRPLTELQSGATAEITHLEDEPHATYRKLLAAGLGLGERLTITASGADDLDIVVSGRRSRLTRGNAGNVTVVELPGAPAETAHRTLADLREGESGRVTGLAPACRGAQRRRLLDLGLVPGTEVAAEMTSAMGDPIAYRVRDALIALRRQQALWVGIE